MDDKEFFKKNKVEVDVSHLDLKDIKAQQEEDMKEIWRLLAEKGEVNLTAEYLKEAPPHTDGKDHPGLYVAPELQKKHDTDCKCTYCKPPAETLQPHQTRPEYKYYRTDSPVKFVSKLDTPEKIKAAYEQIKEVDKDLPPLDHHYVESQDGLDNTILSFMEKQDKESQESNKIQGYDFELKNPYVKKKINKLDADKNSVLKGILVFHVSVGQLPPAKGEAFIDRLKQKYKNVLDRLPKNWDTMWIPIRDHTGTRVEVIRLD